MVTASLVHENAKDVVCLAFSSHDVEITGRNLRELLVALQEFAVKWIRAVPERYQMTMVTTEQGMVSNIRLKTVK